MIKIEQPFNNNVVMGWDRKHGEVVIIGKGIGFHAKKGDIIDESKIQKIFIANENEKLVDLIQQISPEYLELVEDIFNQAKTEYDFSPEEKNTLALMDHIQFAVKRLREGLQVDNPFTTEIKQFYQKEWKLGLYARERIKEMFHVVIPDAEVGYVAMHLIASEFQQDRRSVNKVFQVIDISLDYIRREYLEEVDEDSLSYTRLVTHLKYFAQRYVDNKESTKEDELMQKTVREVFREEVDCIDGLSDLLYNKFGRHITDSEENYLVLHLRNCKL